MNSSITVNSISKSYKLGLTHNRSLRDLANTFFFKSAKQSTSKAVKKNSRVENNSTFWALKDVSFDVSEGEVLGIIGKNGAGKSTLLKILSGITSPTSGSVKIKGRVASLLEVGTGFHPELTGRENTFLNGTILGMSKTDIKKQFDSIVDFSGIENFIDTPVKRYSSGMAVRLGFAVAAHLEPEIMIIDEVLAVGDVEFQKKCLDKMDNVAKSGRTVLFVSHNLSSIRSLTDRSVLLAEGQVKEIGKTTDVVNYYLSNNIKNNGNDVSGLERPFGEMDRAIEFLELEVMNTDASTEENDFIFQFRMKLKFISPSNNFKIGLTIFRDDHSSIGSTFSESVPSEKSGSQQEYEFELSLPELVNGNYHCGISIIEARSGATRLHDSLSDILQFEIANRSFKNVAWKKGWGAVQFSQLKQKLN